MVMRQFSNFATGTVHVGPFTYDQTTPGIIIQGDLFHHFEIFLIGGLHPIPISFPNLSFTLLPTSIDFYL